MDTTVASDRLVDIRRNEHLSGVTRRLTQATAIGSALLGTVLFLAPAWSSERFAWAISPMIAMTIGAWCLGNAVVAWEAARVWRWAAVYPLFVYLWVFAIGELAVLVWFADLIPFDAALTWPYLAVAALSVVAAASGIVDAARLRPTLASDGPRAGPLLRAAWAVFAAVVGLLGILVLLKSSPAEGGVFPEPMTPFTLRAFGVFYLAIACGAAATAVSRYLRPTTMYASRASSLTVLITAASLVYLERFDFGARPGQRIYLGAYLGALVVAAAVVWGATRIERRPGGR